LGKAGLGCDHGGGDAGDSVHLRTLDGASLNPFLKRENPKNKPGKVGRLPPTDLLDWKYKVVKTNVPSHHLLLLDRMIGMGGSDEWKRKSLIPGIVLANR
jgi:hypothetical protein